MICQPISKKARALMGVVAVIGLIGIYSWLSYRQHQINPNDTTMPTPHQFWEGVQKMTTPDIYGRIWILTDLEATTWRLFLGMVTGVGFAFVAGILMGVYLPAAAFLVPPVSFMAKAPPTAMLAIFFIVFGTSTEMFIAMIAFGVFPTLAMSIYTSVSKDITQNSIYKSYTLGATHVEVILEVICRQIWPRILQSIQLVIGPAIVSLIAAEWLMADTGFGYRIRIQTRLQAMSVVYIYIFFLMTIGFVFDYGLTELRRRTAIWFGE